MSEHTEFNEMIKFRKEEKIKKNYNRFLKLSEKFSIEFKFDNNIVYFTNNNIKYKLGLNSMKIYVNRSWEKVSMKDLENIFKQKLE